MSRNKTEGEYTGCIRGKHVRSIPKQYENIDFWKQIFGETSWTNESWPSASDAWIVMYRERGTTFTVYRPRYESKNYFDNPEN